MKKRQKLPNNSKKKLLQKDLQIQFPEIKHSELEALLLDLKRIPELFQKLITDTQANLRVYERYKKVGRKSKKVRTDYKLSLDTVIKIKDATKT
jgi:hypothetical protein